MKPRKDRHRTALMLGAARQSDGKWANGADHKILPDDGPVIGLARNPDGSEVTDESA